MATAFETLWTAAARPAFLAAFGADIVYRPETLARPIRAIVQYVKDDGLVDPVIRHKSPKVQIKVANDSILGIAADEFDSNQTVSVPPRPKASAVPMIMARIVKSNGIWVTFECH
jgi:hypothetical protein